MGAKGWTKPKAFTLVEGLIALAILGAVLTTLYTALNRSLLLSETNKQIKMALFDAQSIVEEMQGIPFDVIMDPDYPTAQNPNPRFRNMQQVDAGRLYGINAATGLPNSPHLDDEKVIVWYGSKLDSTDKNGNGDLYDAEPLTIVAGSDLLTNLVPTTSAPVEQNRPAKNNLPALTEFVTPEPLYVTVEVNWIGPVRTTTPGGQYLRMYKRITFVRGR